MAIGKERYHVDTVRQRWLRLGDAPECTCLYFKNVRDKIIDTEKACVVSDGAYDVIIRDRRSKEILEEYSEIHPIFYADVTLRDELTDTLVNQVLSGLKDELSPSARRRMANDHAVFSIDLLVGNDGLVRESSLYVFMDSLRRDRELLEFCAKVDKAFKEGSLFFKGSIWMKVNDIPHGQIRLRLIMTEDGLECPKSSWSTLLRESKLIRPTYPPIIHI